MSATPYRPWVDAFPQAARWDAPIEIGTLPALLDLAVAEGPARPALSYREARLDYATLGRLVAELSAGFAEAGIGKGETVALYLPNTPFHPIVFFAVLRLGARIAHLSPLDAPRELAHKIKDLGARTLVTTNFPSLLPNALSLHAEGLVERVWVGDDAYWGPSPGVAVPWRPGVSPLMEILRTPSSREPAKISPDDVAVLQYTGGTTGMPKGAMLTSCQFHGDGQHVPKLERALRPRARRRADHLRAAAFPHLRAHGDLVARPARRQRALAASPLRR